MNSLHSLIGEPLDRVVYWLQEIHFHNLWTTGDKILQSRIRNFPLTCKYRPYPYSKNVVRLTDCNITSTEGDMMEMSKGYNGKLIRAFKMTHTLIDAKIVCKYKDWEVIVPFLGSVTSLDVHMRDHLEWIETSIPFPPRLEDLSTNRYDAPVLESLPVHIKSLILKADYELQSILYNAPRPVDLSHLELENFNARDNSFVTTILPRTLTSVTNCSHYLDGNFPNLKSAWVRSINGYYPHLKELGTSTGDLSGCPVLEKVEFARDGVFVIARYEKGTLEIEEDENLWGCAERAKHFPVTYVKWHEVDYNEDDLVLAKRSFPHLKYIRFRCAKVQVDCDENEAIRRCLLADFVE